MPSNEAWRGDQHPEISWEPWTCVSPEYQLSLLHSEDSWWQQSPLSSTDLGKAYSQWAAQGSVQLWDISSSIFSTIPIMMIMMEA